MSSRDTRVPNSCLLEFGLPVEEMYQLARREGNAKKPIYEIHKWWARRLGHIFRAMLIAATMPAPVSRKKSEFRKILQRFYEQNNLKGLTVLDPFMGGGTSVVEALKCGARVIGVDIDPVAWFITKKEVEPFDESGLRRSFKHISSKVEESVRSLYETSHRPGIPAEVVNAFWVSRFTCPKCDVELDAHPHYRLAFSAKNNIQQVFCRFCESVQAISYKFKSFTCNSCQKRTVVNEGPARQGVLRCQTCRTKTKIVDLIETGKPSKKHLFAIEYSFLGPLNEPIRGFKKADHADKTSFEKAEHLLRAHTAALEYPRTEIFTANRFDGRPVTHGYSRYEQLFNARQLYCLSTIFKEILALRDVNSREYLLLAFSDCLASNNELVSYAFGYQKITPLFAIHGYQVPQRPVEGNVWGNPSFGRGSFSRCVEKMIEGQRYSQRPFEFKYSASGDPKKIFTGESIATKVVSAGADQNDKSRAWLINSTSSALERIPSDSVDLILTDPPFYNNLAYSELSDFYYQWLRLYFTTIPNTYNAETTPVDSSLLVKRKTYQEHSMYLEGLAAALGECARVLKPKGLMSFTFHHREAAAWHALASALARANFTVTGVCPVRAEGVSGFHSYAGTPKWDAVISCRPRTKAPSSQPDRKLRSLIADIRKCESKWTRRLVKAKLPWFDADRTSFAFALALQVAVNLRLSDQDCRALLAEVARCYPQHGVSPTIPIPTAARA
jgi:putative DNA methylase